MRKMEKERGWGEEEELVRLKSGGRPRFLGKYPTICAGRKSRWSGKPDRTSSADDSRIDSPGTADPTWDRRQSHSSLSWCGRCRRFALGSGRGVSPYLSGRGAQPAPLCPI